jgi:hypothetical protein
MQQSPLAHLFSLFQNRQFSLFDEEASHLLNSNPPAVFKAKILGWCAQSKQRQNRINEAIELYNQAIKEAEQAEDVDGVHAFREEIFSLIEQQKAMVKIQKNSSDPLQSGINLLKTQNTARAEMLLLSSVAQADEDGEPKGRVLARLALARIPTYQTTMLTQALEIAQDTGDMNLVTAVKKTMDQVGEKIAPHVF